jgi:probable HAF family extracellular repeat protein
MVATLWPASPAPTPVPLGLLPVLPRSVANAINDDLVVVGYAEDLNFGSSRRAWVWTPASGMRDLNGISDAADAGLTLINAAAINASGQIVGTASVGEFGAYEHAFLATPVPEAPAAWPALGALALLWRRRRA